VTTSATHVAIPLNPERSPLVVDGKGKEDARVDALDLEDGKHGLVTGERGRDTGHDWFTRFAEVNESAVVSVRAGPFLYEVAKLPE
jgi:hypothetical protein